MLIDFNKEFKRGTKIKIKSLSEIEKVATFTTISGYDCFMFPIENGSRLFDILSAKKCILHNSHGYFMHIYFFSAAMSVFCNKILTIEYLCKTAPFTYKVAENSWAWSFWMFDLLYGKSSTKLLDVD